MKAPAKIAGEEWLVPATDDAEECWIVENRPGGFPVAAADVGRCRTSLEDGSLVWDAPDGRPTAAFPPEATANVEPGEYVARYMLRDGRTRVSVPFDVVRGGWNTATDAPDSQHIPSGWKS